MRNIREPLTPFAMSYRGAMISSRKSARPKSRVPRPDAAITAPSEAPPFVPMSCRCHCCRRA
eukprot:1342463-Lingulodinium_polyedra.AAC.1